MTLRCIDGEDQRGIIERPDHVLEVSQAFELNFALIVRCECGGNVVAAFTVRVVNADDDIVQIGSICCLVLGKARIRSWSVLRVESIVTNSDD